MTDKISNVANFALSKDFSEQVKFQIHSLRGITSSFLFRKIYIDDETQKDIKATDSPSASSHSDCTNALIEYKLKKQLSEAEIITEIHIESGIGKKLTVPVIIGLTGEMEKETCRLETDTEDNIIYIDDTFIKFTPSKGLADATSKVPTSSIFTNNTVSSSNASSLSTVSATRSSSLLSENTQWIELPIEYCKLPIEANIVFTTWCYNVRTAEKILLSTGRMSMFNETCTLNTGRITIVLEIAKNESDTEALITNEKDIDYTSKESVLEKIQFNNNRPLWLNKLTLSKIDALESKSIFSPNYQNSKVELSIGLPDFEIPIVFSDIKYVPISLPVYDPSNSVLNYDPTFNEITYANTKTGTIENNLPNIYSTDSLPFDPDQVRGEQMEDPVEQKFRRLERMQHLSPLDKELKPTLKMREALSHVMKKQFFEKMTAKERNMVWRYRWFMLTTLIIGNTPGWNNALINFIKCVDWNNNSEINEFELILKNLRENTSFNCDEIYNWSKESAFDIFIQKLQIIDCLELLSSNYKNSIVRGMAVKRLHSFGDSELSMFMVQLVQNIKNETFFPKESQDERFKDNYENYENGRSLSVSNVDVVHIDEEENELKPPNSAKSADTSNYTLASSEYQIVDTVNENCSSDAHIVEFIDNILFKNKKLKNLVTPEVPSKFIDLLIFRSIRDSSLTNYFYWCLKVEVEEEQIRNKKISAYGLTTNTSTIKNNIQISGENNKNFTIKSSKDVDNESADNMIFRLVHELTMKKFIITLVQSQHGKLKLYELRRQIELVDKLHTFCFKIKVEHRKETTPMKVEILKEMLNEKHKRTIFGSKYDSRNILLDDSRHESMVEFPKLAIPLDPSVIVNGTFPDESAVFKSSLNPLKITFKTTNGEKYPIMYKIGDDLRQDQFVIQIITLMEKILETENMDLKLKPYKILATGEVEGFIQFIPNNSLSHILSKYNNSILLYLQTFNPDPTANLGVNPQVMDNYVRSCAGYCVVTYILGVGDRHLENLLLSKDGHFFHADFGYILGQDPKPFPPLMKLPIQIIEGMGGSENINYKTFCQYCFITYITLRKNASLILNLVQLMINTSIPALRTVLENSEAEKMELLWKVEEKFMLDLNDEEAVLHFQNLIDSSVNAVLPVVIDRLHNLAQYWRS